MYRVECFILNAFLRRSNNIKMNKIENKRAVFTDRIYGSTDVGGDAE